MTNNKNIFHVHAISDIQDKGMANGMRNNSRTLLTEDEIEFIIQEIKRIEADEAAFIFNDPEHVTKSTCYNYDDNKIYVTKNVLPDIQYGSAHPRDTMSVGAVLAHEYYGHRPHRQEYLSDLEKGVNYHTVPIWQDGCRASLTAAQVSPGLTNIDRRDLVLDAICRAREYGQLIEMNDFMRQAVYGYTSNERSIARTIEQPKYVSEESKV